MKSAWRNRIFIATGPSPHGEGGLKSRCQVFQGITPQRPSPHGEGGLKFLILPIRPDVDRSLPTRGGWIEIMPDERTLVALAASLPTRGGWIEIPWRGQFSTTPSWSLPTRGGWIEICAIALGLQPDAGPSPHGEGGLKSGSTKLGTKPS